MGRSPALVAVPIATASVHKVIRPRYGLRPDVAGVLPTAELDDLCGGMINYLSFSFNFIQTSFIASAPISVFKRIFSACGRKLAWTALVSNFWRAFTSYPNAF